MYIKAVVYSLLVRADKFETATVQGWLVWLHHQFFTHHSFIEEGVRMSVCATKSIRCSISSTDSGFVHETIICNTTGEATHLASDFKRICETYFPHTELAQIIARQHTGTPQAQHRVSMVKAAQ